MMHPDLPYPISDPTAGPFSWTQTLVVWMTHINIEVSIAMH